MRQLTKRLSIAVVTAGLVAASSMALRAQESSHEAHHPAAAVPGEPQTPTPDAAAEHGAPVDAKMSGGMMSGDQMPMMKMMHEMHAKMMGGGMLMQPKGDGGPSSQAFNGLMGKMRQDMDMTYTGNADVDFVKAMIPHHQAAVDMAKTALAFGKDPEVRTFAEGIIKAQEAEIAWSKEWLKRQGQ